MFPNFTSTCIRISIKSREWEDGGGNLFPVISPPEYVNVYSEY
jgi:hypothetical protein